MFVAKYDSSGTLLWVKKAGGATSDAGNSVAFDNSGNVIVTGEFSGSCSFGTIVLNSLNGSLDIFTAKYDSNGILMWVKKGSGKYTDRGTAVSADTSGNIYVTGMFSDTIIFDNVHNNSIYNSIFLIKYTPGGAEQWFRWMGSGSTNGVAGMAVHNNNIDLTGNFSGTLYFFGNGGNPTLSSINTFNIFILRYNLQGSLVWTRADGSESEVKAEAVTEKNNGQVIVAGDFKCRFTDFSSHYGTEIFCSVGFYDTYIASYSNSGNWQWARQFGGRWDDFAHGVCVHNDSVISSTGSFAQEFIAPINPALYNTHNNELSLFSCTNTYCSDNNYAHYSEYISNGNSDVYINTAVDLSRKPYDYFARSGNICDRPFNDICIRNQGNINCIDTIIQCGGDMLLVNFNACNAVGPAHTYLWNTGSTDSTLNVSATGLYSVSTTTSDGCFTNTDSIYFISHPFPLKPRISDSKGVNVDALFTTALQLCAPDSATLTCTNVGGNIVHWSGFPVGQNPVIAFTPGAYLVTLTNVYSCVSSNYIDMNLDSILTFPPVIPLIKCVSDTDGNDSIALCQYDIFEMLLYDSITNPLGNLACFRERQVVDGLQFLQVFLTNYRLALDQEFFLRSFQVNMIFYFPVQFSVEIIVVVTVLTPQ
jgi:hypothetical protein